MMIVYSEKHTENSEEMTRILQSEVLRFASRHGIPYRFMTDSKAIQDSIAMIASRVASLSESVVIDNDMIRMNKEEEDFKTAMENMGVVERNLRKTKKQGYEKRGAKHDKNRKSNQEGK